MSGEQTTFHITVTRHATEQEAMKKAMSVMEMKMAAHQLVYPKSALGSVIQKSAVTSSGHSATVVATAV